MATVVVGFGELHGELEKAKESLKCIDENIKKLTGRDPAEARAIAQQRRNSSGQTNPNLIGLGENSRGRPGMASSGFNREMDARRWDPLGGGDGPPQAKRRALGTVYGRLGGDRRDRRGGRDNDSGDDMPHKPTVQSSVVAYPKEQKTRKDCIDEQKTDATGMARNRRMFGLLLGTLQKFRVESQQTHVKEQKRMEIERKLEEIAEKEREDLRRERIELFQERKRRQGELRRLEFKLELVKQHEEWEKHYDHLRNFIRTKTKPHVYYLPREPSAVSEKRLADTQQEIDAMIAEKRQRIEEDVVVLGKRRAELGNVMETTNSDGITTITKVIINEGASLAVATKRKRQGNEAKNGKVSNADDDSSSTSSSSSSSSSEDSDSGSGSSSGSDDDDDDGEANEKPLKKQAGKRKTIRNEDTEAGQNEAEAEGEGEEEGDDSRVGETQVAQSEPNINENIQIPPEETSEIQINEKPAIVDNVNDDNCFHSSIKAEPDFHQVTSSADDGEALKKNDGTEFPIVATTVDILDQSNLTEKEFEPIYD